jgi:SAM-dependent methyltransferase
MYQTHGDKPGDSNSQEKLHSLRLPGRLTGKSVLDLGCNEGFFALEVKRRGAQRVLGIDHNEKVIAAARQRALDAGLDVEFVCRDVLDLPDEKFDFVLLLSALHYIADPKTLFKRILQILSPDGNLVLECGVAPGRGRTLHRALRVIDDRMFPTFEMLRDVWLPDYAVRFVSRSPFQQGDPIPRYVYQCHARKPIVLLIRGGSGSGKSLLASTLSSSVTISTDALFLPARNDGRMFYPEAQKLYDEEFRKYNGSHGRAWDALKEQKHIRQFFADTIARAVRLSHAELITVEGYVVGDLVQELIEFLGGEYRCWTVDAATHEGDPLEEQRERASALREAVEGGDRQLEEQREKLSALRKAAQGRERRIAALEKRVQRAEKLRNRWQKDFTKLNKWSERILQDLERLLKSRRWRIGCWLSLKRVGEKSKEAQRLVQLLASRPQPASGSTTASGEDRELGRGQSSSGRDAV